MAVTESALTETPSKPFWALTVQETLRLLKTAPDGLTEDEYNARIARTGLNIIEAEQKFIKTKIFLRQLASPLIFILIIAGLATLFLNELVDASVIFLAIAVNTALGFYQENRAENSLEKLRSYITERVRVIRGGVEQEVDAERVVVGDIIHLASGGRVPADARVISENAFTVDEAILTGESLPVAKTTAPLSEAAALPERSNMVFGGTLVVDGYGTACITATGRNAEIGKIADLIAASKRRKVPLQVAMAKLAWLIAAGIVLLVAAIFLLGFVKGEPLFDMFLISVAVAVGAIPEALPIALTVVLAVGVEQMAKRNAIMRNLTAAETLGSTTVIVTDKTGTLTEATMRLVDLIPTETLLAKQAPLETDFSNLSPEQRELLALAHRNTDTVIENPHDPPEKWRIAGKILEVNIVRAMATEGLNPEQAWDAAQSQLLLPFSSVHKFSVSYLEHVHQTSAIRQGRQPALVVLGAPDILLKKAALSRDEYLQAIATVEKLSDAGKRVVGLGIKSLRHAPVPTGTIAPEAVSDITFLGVLCFHDPVRAEVPQAIKEIEASGVRVIMATGDLKGTALAVARTLGWDITEGNVLTGQELNQLSDEELLQHIDKVKIYARVTPEDKRRIGLLLKKRGEVVGMTGDGVNDAPSLKAVDIGIAVGSGSDVAKDVADIVLLDDNFLTIAAAIEEGRRTLSNIRKAFVYLVSNSLDEVILIGGSLLAGLALPLTALQIIWVNFFTGSLPALSFAFDDFNDKHLMNARSSRTVLDKEVKFLTIVVGTLTSLLLFALYWGLSYTSIPELKVRTFIFACFASYILFIAFSFRSLKRPLFTYNVFSNRFLNFSVLFGLVLIALTLYVPFLQTIFNTTALELPWLLALALWLVVNLGLVELVKFLYRNT